LVYYKLSLEDFESSIANYQQYNVQNSSKTRRNLTSGDIYNYGVIRIQVIPCQGLHKSWKILEFKNLDSRAGKSWNFCRCP